MLLFPGQDLRLDARRERLSLAMVLTQCLLQVLVHLPQVIRRCKSAAADARDDAQI